MIDKERLPIVSKPEMNDVHREEAELVNTLLSAIDEEEERGVTGALEKLLEHMREHFDYEESMLKNRGFGMFDIHRNDHGRIMNETRMAYMNWRNFRDREALKAFIEEDFIEWLKLHIQAMDSVAADFLMRHGDEG
ncbi:bacteriohemerythrin [Hydrogenimonas sp.]